MIGSNAALDSQQIFRVLLQATASPGEIMTLPRAGNNPSEALLSALLDQEVTFCVIGEATKLEERLSLQTGARVAEVTGADFALVLNGGSRGAVLKLKRGTLETPQEGSTAIYAVQRLAGCGSLMLKLSGPGVPGTRALGVEGLAGQELEVIHESRARYPLGVDIYLVDEAWQMAALPRSTFIEAAG